MSLPVSPCAVRKARRPPPSAARSPGSIAASTTASASDLRSATSFRSCRPRPVRTSCTSRRLCGCSSRSSRPAASSRSHNRLAVGGPMSMLSASVVRLSPGSDSRTRRALSWCGDSLRLAPWAATDQTFARPSTASAISSATESGSTPGPLDRPSPEPLRRVTHASLSVIAWPCRYRPHSNAVPDESSSKHVVAPQPHPSATGGDHIRGSATGNGKGKERTLLATLKL